jgi:DNA-binding PadR family transcriptional regulator
VSRVFRRGELQRAVLAVLDDVGSANGYVIMQSLAERLGGRWRPSPGAVYPALMGLEDAGLVTTREVDGAKTYRLSSAGERQARPARDAFADVVARAERQRPPDPTVGRLLDQFAERAPARHRALEPDQARQVEALLDRLLHDIESITTKGST